MTLPRTSQSLELNHVDTRIRLAILLRPALAGLLDDPTALGGNGTVFRLIQH